MHLHCRVPPVTASFGGARVFGRWRFDCVNKVNTCASLQLGTPFPQNHACPRSICRIPHQLNRAHSTTGQRAITADSVTHACACNTPQNLSACSTGKGGRSTSKQGQPVGHCNTHNLSDMTLKHLVGGCNSRQHVSPESRHSSMCARAAIVLCQPAPAEPRHDGGHMCGYSKRQHLQMHTLKGMSPQAGEEAGHLSGHV